MLSMYLEIKLNNFVTLNLQKIHVFTSFYIIDMTYMSNTINLITGLKCLALIHNIIYSDFLISECTWRKNNLCQYDMLVIVF